MSVLEMYLYRFEEEPKSLQCNNYLLDTIQKILCELGMKPRMQI